MAMIMSSRHISRSLRRVSSLIIAVTSVVGRAADIADRISIIRIPYLLFQVEPVPIRREDRFQVPVAGGAELGKSQFAGNVQSLVGVGFAQAEHGQAGVVTL